MSGIISRLNQVQFKEILNKINNVEFAQISDYKFEDEFHHTSKGWKSEGIIFKNCTFEKSFLLEDVDVKCGIRFEDCTFKAGISLRRCIGDSFNPAFNDDYNSFMHFSNSNIIGNFTLHNCDFKYGFRAIEKTNFNFVAIISSSFESFYFEASNIQTVFDIHNTSSRHGFRFHKCTLDSQFRFHDCRTDICFTQSIVNRDVFLSDCELTNLTTNDGIIKDTLNISDCTILSSLTLAGTTFEKEVIVKSDLDSKNKNIENLWLGGSDFKGGFSIIGNKSSKKTLINKIQITCTDRLMGYINIENCLVNECQIEGINSASSITFAYSRINVLGIQNFINKAALSFISLASINDDSSSIFISKSVLGKTLFSDCNLKSYKKVMIIHTNLTEITTTSIEWFDLQNINSEYIKHSISDILVRTVNQNMETRKAFNSASEHVKKDLFRQLKFAMEKQGDNFNSLVFKREEMKSYRNYLRSYPTTLSNFGDKFIVFLSQSNDYGFNWLKPLTILLTCNVIFYVILAININPNLGWRFDVKQIGSTINYLSNDFYNYFSLLNPTHRISDLFKINEKTSAPSFGFYALDFLQRAFLSYLIFQTISAFRKYLK